MSLNINGYTVVRDLSKNCPWEVFQNGKKIRSFKSYLQVIKFLFPA